nr:hypothetical protein CFP56_00980 [Quercus suber]
MGGPGLDMRAWRGRRTRQNAGGVLAVDLGDDCSGHQQRGLEGYRMDVVLVRHVGKRDGGWACVSAIAIAMAAAFDIDLDGQVGSHSRIGEQPDECFPLTDPCWTSKQSLGTGGQGVRRRSQGLMAVMIGQDEPLDTSMQRPKVPLMPLRTVSPQIRQHNTSSSTHETSGIGEVHVAKRSRTSRPKCDETKPNCNRCSSTGRKCDGYVILPRKQRGGDQKQINWLLSNSSVPLRMLGLVTVSETESSALQFFHERSANALSRFFDAAFWTNLVLRMSASEASVRHAMIAVGSLHRQRETGMQNIPMRKPFVTDTPLVVSAPLTGIQTDPNDPFVIAHYNRAISHLSGRLQDPETSIEITLVTCILFVCIEYLRGDIKPALRHFNAGMNIALNAMKKTNSPTSLERAQRIRSSMLPFLRRVELLSFLFGNEAEEAPNITGPPAPMPSESSAFNTIQDARDSIVLLMNQSLRVIQHIKRKKQQSQVVSADEVAHQKLLCQKLQDWTVSLKRLVETSNFSSEVLDGTKVLQVHEIVTRVWLSNCISDDEMQHDQHLSSFEKATVLCEEIQTVAGTRMQRAQLPSTFLFDMEVVSPLYYIATKCRHPVLRRKAIALLRRTARKEGLWNSNLAASIAERTMQLEEAHLDVLDGSQLPVEHDRICNTEASAARESQLETHNVTFIYALQPQAGRRVYKETITLPPAQSDPLSLDIRKPGQTKLDAT